jgi:hypothetical protein
MSEATEQGGAHIQGGAHKGDSAAPPGLPGLPTDDLAVADGQENDEDSDEDGPRPELRRVTSTDEEGKRKEAELRQYLANHRRRSEAFGSGPKNPKADEAGGEPSEAATGVGAAAGSSSDTKAAGGAEGAGGFDMFSETFTEKEIDGPNMEEVDEAALMDRGDNYDDKEGYYAHRVGDILNDRYKVRRARMRRLLLHVLLGTSRPRALPKG